jgi:tetratricopeptide (TPR) repeat protein
MSKTEWFRRTTWSDADREDFNAHLKRSRGAGNKAQYLRIQAGHLADGGHHAAAIELLDRLFAEFPQRIELAQAHAQKTDSLAKLGQLKAAIQEYRSALQAERDLPNIRTNAWLDFGWLVVEKQLTDSTKKYRGYCKSSGGKMAKSSRSYSTVTRRFKRCWPMPVVRAREPANSPSSP